MRKIILLTITSLLTICFLVTNSMSMSNLSFIDKIKLTSSDIPRGYQIGKIPDFAKSVLKKNPWHLDKNAIRKLAHRIYPGCDERNISKLHMTILASKKNPYGDDIVCYIFLFKDSKRAKEETRKIKKFVTQNRDRSIIVEKGKTAVYLLVDKTDDYPKIKDISQNIKNKMDNN